MFVVDGIGVMVGTLVGVFVGNGTDVLVGCSVAVLVGVGVGVFVGNGTGVLVGCGVGVFVGVFTGVLVGGKGVFVGGSVPPTSMTSTQSLALLPLLPGVTNERVPELANVPIVV